MNNVMRIVAGAAMATSMLFAGAGTAAAEERRCTGTIGSVTVDNVKVPSGETCRLNGTRVEGTINVNRNARLFADGARIVGNVQAENAKRVEVRGGRVGGDIQVVQGDRAFVKNVSVGGTILFDDQSELVEARRNNVKGSIQAFQNTGGVVIRNNVVDANLQCKENDPRPRGGGNRVEGSKEDQCKQL